MIIYVRHSQDEFNPKYFDDPKITHWGKKLAENTGKKLITRYGTPSLILTSPFRRTRMSSYAMIDNKHIIIDPILSRFSSDKKLKLSRTTNKLAIKNETEYDFDRRINDIFEKYKKYQNSQDVVWCVTHTTVYKKLTKLYGVQIKSHISPMAYFIIN